MRHPVLQRSSVSFLSFDAKHLLICLAGTEEATTGHGPISLHWTTRIGDPMLKAPMNAPTFPGNLMEKHGITTRIGFGLKCETQLFFICQVDESPNNTPDRPWGTTAGDRWGPTTTGDRWGPTTAGDRWGPTTAGDRWGPTTAGDRWGPTTAGDRWGPTTAGDRWGPTTTGDRWGPTTTGDRWGPTTTGDRWGPTATGDRWGPTNPWGQATGDPMGTNNSRRPMGTNNGRPMGTNQIPMGTN